MNNADKNTSILSVSSNKIKNCNIVAEFFKKNKIMCSVTENISVVPYKDNFEIEIGCNILFNSHKPELINHNLWYKLKNEFDLTCSHLKVEGKFKGCIYNYLNNKTCPI